MFGGYSQSITISEKFVLRISHPADQLAPVPPLLRAGMITYSPLAGPGKKVGIVGIGGLGHMGMKLAHAMGAHVVALTTSENKRQDALDLGARHRKRLWQDTEKRRQISLRHRQRVTRGKLITGSMVNLIAGA